MKKRLEQHYQQNPALTTSVITVVMVIVIVFVKAFALWLSGSTAVLSALIDSLSDVGLSLMTVVTVRWSMKPADDNHRHGHGKVEGVAALIQSSMLLGGAVFLLLESFGRLISPVTIEQHGTTLVLMGISVVLSYLIAVVQRLGAQKSGSLAVEADSLHYSSDILINGSVFLVILLDYAGIVGNWLDPLCAVGVAVVMMRAAYHIAQKAFGMLLDEELPDDVRHRIIAKIKSHPEVLGFHDLRTTQSGMKQFIAFDIEADPDLSLQSAHDIARTLENCLLQDFPKAEIMIHIDPVGDTTDSRHRHHHGHIEGDKEVVGGQSQ